MAANFRVTSLDSRLVTFERDLYDEAYYRDLHPRHWFKSPARKESILPASSRPVLGRSLIIPPRMMTTNGVFVCFAN